MRRRERGPAPQWTFVFNRRFKEQKQHVPDVGPPSPKRGVVLLERLIACRGGAAWCSPGVSLDLNSLTRLRGGVVVRAV